MHPETFNLLGHAVRAPQSMRAGHEPRFRALARLELAYLWVTLERLGVPRVRLEAATRCALRVLRRELPLAEDRSSLRPLLFTCAFIAAREHACTQPLSLVRIVPVDRTERTTLDARDLERRAPLLRALAALSTHERAIYVLHDIDGVSAPDVARTLGVTGRAAAEFHVRIASVRTRVLALAALSLGLHDARRVHVPTPTRMLPPELAELLIVERYPLGPSMQVRARLYAAIDAMRAQEQAAQAPTMPAPAPIATATPAAPSTEKRAKAPTEPSSGVVAA